jgi:UDP-perosamine 4-acetyltransferase
VKVLVIGAGGHAKVVIDAARAAGYVVVAAIGSPDGASDVLGVPVVPSAEGISADGFIVAVGDNRHRAALFSEYTVAGLTAVPVVHPSAVIAEGAEIAEGAFVAAGVVVNPGARIGCNAILNTGCTVDHDCVIGSHAHIGPGVNLCGGTTIGVGTLVGVGACAIPGTVVGAWCTVGAGASVVDPVPDGLTVVGVPAREQSSG